MGTMQKGSMMKKLVGLFTAGIMSMNGGHHIPNGSHQASNANNPNFSFRGSSKSNNRTPHKVQYSLVRTCSAISALFRNRSTGVGSELRYKVL